MGIAVASVNEDIFNVAMLALHGQNAYNHQISAFLKKIKLPCPCPVIPNSTLISKLLDQILTLEDKDKKKGFNLLADVPLFLNNCSYK